MPELTEIMSAPITKLLLSVKWSVRRVRTGLIHEPTASLSGRRRRPHPLSAGGPRTSQLSLADDRQWGDHKPPDRRRRREQPGCDLQTVRLPGPRKRAATRQKLSPAGPRQTWELVSPCVGNQRRAARALPGHRATHLARPPIVGIEGPRLEGPAEREGRPGRPAETFYDVDELEIPYLMPGPRPDPLPAEAHHRGPGAAQGQHRQPHAGTPAAPRICQRLAPGRRRPGRPRWRPLHRALAARGVRQLRHLRASDRAIAHQTRHRSLASVETCVGIHQAWEDNAATMLGLWTVVTRPVERRRQGHG